MNAAPRALVLGGGVAGIAAAFALREAGRRVTLIEKRAFLGGRAYSFVDRRSGDEIDNGQHVLLGCCTNALGLLADLGTDAEVEWHDTFRYLAAGGARHDLAPSALPAPAHLLPAILGWGALESAERRAVVRAVLHLLAGSRARLAREGRMTMAAWLAERRQPERAVRRFWEPIVVGAVNESLERVAAAPCFKVFLEAFLSSREATLMGVPRAGLSQLIGEPARRRLEERGVELRLRGRALSIEVAEGRATGLRLAGDESLAAEEIVVALPAEALARVALSDGGPLVDAPTPDRVGRSSITGVHLWLDRPVTEISCAALLDSPMHWFFARPTVWREARQRLSLIVSASRELEPLGQGEIAALALDELRRFLPEAAAAELRHAVVIKELRATFSATPDFEALRPGPGTRLRNVALAGDWTATGWPSTLEGAIRSGRRAAARLLGPGAAGPGPDLPPALLSRLLFGRHLPGSEAAAPSS